MGTTWCHPKSFFSMLSLHINNQFAKKRGIGKKSLLTIRAVMLQELVDLVAGEFNGAAWRRQCGGDRKLTSIIEEAFADTNLPVPPGPPPLWDKARCRANGLMYVGLSSHQTHMKSGRYAYILHLPTLAAITHRRTNTISACT